MLDMVGINIPNYKMRDILNDLRKSGDTKGDLLSKTGFEKVSKDIFPLKITLFYGNSKTSK